MEKHHEYYQPGWPNKKNDRCTAVFHLISGPFSYILKFESCENTVVSVAQWPVSIASWIMVECVAKVLKFECHELAFFWSSLRSSSSKQKKQAFCININTTIKWSTHTLKLKKSDNFTREPQININYFQKTSTGGRFIHWSTSIQHAISFSFSCAWRTHEECAPCV